MKPQSWATQRVSWLYLAIAGFYYATGDGVTAAWFLGFAMYANLSSQIQKIREEK